MKGGYNKYSILLFLPLLWSCANMDYDTSRGIDKEMTLFTDEISIPIAGIGPLSPKQLLGDVDLGSTLGNIFKEDENGYLVVEKEETIYSNPVLLLYMSSLDPSQPLDVNIVDFTGYPGASTESPANMGLSPALQEFSLYALNPLTDEIAVSGKVTLSAQAKDDSPAQILSSENFDRASVPAESNDGELLHTEIDGQSILDVCSLEDMALHLPASFLEKDPLGGFSSITLGYRYKAYLSLVKDFPMQIPIPINDLDLPLAQYRVKEVLLSTEVSNEIPLTLVLESVDVMVKGTDEEGNAKNVVCEDVSVTPGLTVASGSSASPVVSSLAISIKALEGTIPDIAGLQLNLSVKAPTGEGDKRLNMNQSICFNNIRAAVGGGITIRSL